MRQILLDTETTGLNPLDGHRIIEIGCVEMISRRATGNDYWQYIQPDRLVDEGAIEVHGIDNEFLADKPRMADIAESFLDYVRGAELIIHNAAFDVGFINHELSMLGESWGKIQDICTITDTLAMARKMRPGQRNSLDALCNFYGIDNTHRELHGALLDARILADVYLLMTGGQRTLSLSEDEQRDVDDAPVSCQPIERDAPLTVIQASSDEIQSHLEMLEMLAQSSGSKVKNW